MPAVSPGVHIEEPEGFSGQVGGAGYDLRGASHLIFDAQSPTGATVRFGMGGNVTSFVELPAASGFRTICIRVDRSRPNTCPVDTDLNLSLPSTPRLGNVHLLFTVVTNDVNAPSGATVLIDNVRYLPVPASRAEALGFPVSNETFGVLPAGEDPIPLDQVLRNIATIYESSLVAMALMERGTSRDLEGAELLLDTFVYALEHDNQAIPLPRGPASKRGLRNSYEAGDIALLNDQGPGAGRAGDARLAGFSASTELCGGTRFCLVFDSSTGGNYAFAMMALIQGYERFGDARYLDAARAIGEWVEAVLRDPSASGYGGYRLGHEDEGRFPKALIEGKSVENNGDLVLVFEALAAIESRLGNAGAAIAWEERADAAGAFVLAMVDAESGCIHPGTVPSGTPQQPGILPDGPQRGGDVINTFPFMDTTTFTFLPLAASPKYRDAVDWRGAIECMRVGFERTVSSGGKEFVGFNIIESATEVPEAVAWEFTGQAVVALLEFEHLFGAPELLDNAALFADEILRAQSGSAFGDGLGLTAATLDVAVPEALPPIEHCASTPFQCIPIRVGLAATAWAIFALDDVNPFLRTMPDSDADRVPDPWDNCPGRFNRLQKDGIGDGIGDACQDQSDHTPPTHVSLITPASGDVVAGRVMVRGTAGDESGTVARMVFEMDLGFAVRECADEEPKPSGSVFACEVSSAGAEDLSQLSVTATAFDGDGNSRSSNPIFVRVRNPDLSLTFVDSALRSSLVEGTGGAGRVRLVVRNLGTVALASGQRVDATVLLAAQAGGVARVLATLAGQSLSRLGPGKSKTLTATVTVGGDVLAGLYTLAAQVDVGDAVVESDETNNGAQGPALEVAAPYVDLVAEVQGAKLPSPTTAGGGATLTLPVSVSNVGNVSLPAGQAVSIAVLARPGSGGEDTTVAVFEKQSLSALQPDAAKRLSLKLKVPAGLESGEYTLVAVVDAGDAVAERDEANNEAASPGFELVKGSVDLSVAVGTETLPPAVVLGAGAGGKVAVRVGNTGDVKLARGQRIDASVMLEPLAGGEAVALARVARFSVSGLAPGKTKTLNATVRIPKTTPEAVYRLVVRVDEAGAVAEENEDNNTAIGPELTVAKPFVDLVASFDPKSVVPPLRIAGDGAAFDTIVRVRNAGNVRVAGGQRIDLQSFIDAEPLAAAGPTKGLSISRLAPGQSKTVTVRSFAPAGVIGRFPIRVAVDSADAVVEPDENNNVIVSGAAVRILDGFTDGTFDDAPGLTRRFRNRSTGELSTNTSVDIGDGCTRTDSIYEDGSTGRSVTCSSADTVTIESFLVELEEGSIELRSPGHVALRRPVVLGQTQTERSAATGTMTFVDPQLHCVVDLTSGTLTTKVTLLGYQTITVPHGTHPAVRMRVISSYDNYRGTCQGVLFDEIDLSVAATVWGSPDTGVLLSTGSGTFKVCARRAGAGCESDSVGAETLELLP